VRTTRSLGLALAVFIFVGSAAPSLGQLPKPAARPAAKAQPQTAVDPLGRETPRRAILGLLKCTEREDYENASLYFQPTPGKNTNLTQRAKEFRALQRRFKSNIALLSDDLQTDSLVRKLVPSNCHRLASLLIPCP
jgi:hypothetical protein